MDFLCDLSNDSVQYNDSKQVVIARNILFFNANISGWNRTIDVWSLQGTISTTKSLYEGTQVSFKASYYLQRMVKYSGASSCCYVVAVMYLERFKIINRAMVLTSGTVQRLLLVAVMTAAKYLEDVAILNTRW